MTTTNDTLVTEEQEKLEEQRLAELAKKQEQITEDERKELGELKEKKQTRYQKRIDELTWRSRTAEENRVKAEKEAEELRQKVADLEKTKNEEKPIKEETVTFEGKRWYTDNTLVAMVKSGQMTSDEAYQHQRSRDRAEDREAVLSRIENKEKEKSEQEIRKQDAQEILKEYPHFSKDHKDYNPNDPLYKLATEIYTEGYSSNPRGLSKAIERAKQILKVSDSSIDRSEDLSTEDSTPNPRGSSRLKEKEITLEEHEKEAVIRLWTHKENPRTGKEYTEQEALAKGLQAKKARLAR